MLHNFGHSLTIAHSRKCNFPTSVTQNYNYEQHKHTIFLLLTINYRFLVSKSHICIQFVPAPYPTPSRFHVATASFVSFLQHAFCWLPEWPEIPIYLYSHRFTEDHSKTTDFSFIHRHNYLKNHRQMLVIGAIFPRWRRFFKYLWRFLTFRARAFEGWPPECSPCPAGRVTPTPWCSYRNLPK